jgi:hypothetical protein
MLADAVGDAGKLSLGALSIDHYVAKFVGQRDEVAFGIDDDLLNPLRRLFQKTAQQMRLSGTGIALHEQSGCQQLLDIERGGTASGCRSHIDTNLQAQFLFQNNDGSL